MPTYEYKCTICDGRFEIEQSITEDSLTRLAGCGDSEDREHHLKKVFSAIGIAFKGDGFYRNDARSGSSSKSEAGSNGSDSSSGTDSDSSSSSDAGSSSDSSSTDKSKASASASSASSD